MTNDIEGKVREILIQNFGTKEWEKFFGTQTPLTTGGINGSFIIKNQSKIDSALSSILSLTTKDSGLGDCDVCWTSSWMPVPKGTPNAQQVKGKDEWVLCQMCEADRNIIKLTTKADTDDDSCIENCVEIATLQEEIVDLKEDIEELKNKAELDEKEVEKIITENHLKYYGANYGSWEEAHAICSHFSKPSVPRELALFLLDNRNVWNNEEWDLIRMKWFKLEEEYGKIVHNLLTGGK